MRFRLLFCLVVLAFGIVQESSAQKVRVVTRTIKPFSFEEDGRRTGFAMDLWADIARESGIEYEVQEVATAQEMVDALVNKTADAGVGALSATAKRETIIDFSQPFYESGLQILTTGTAAPLGEIIWQLLTGIFTWKLFGAFSLLVVVMVLISHFVWLYEHKVNPEMWPGSYRHGMWESFWWTISTLLVGGADNKGPIGVGGRIVAIIWMLLSILLLALLTASFTATITLNTLKGEIDGPGDLPGRKVATIRGSTTEAWLNKRDSTVITFANLQECIAALKKKDVAAVVYDAPLLQFAVSNDPAENLQLIEPIFERQNYAIGLQQDSPLRERINQALLSLSEDGTVQKLRDNWFNKKTK